VKIQKILSQHRRDFQAVYECEHCGTTMKSYGYDDANFHNYVIPSMKCSNCGKTSGDDYRPLATKYPEGQVV
jgi:transcription elongation factor Elf1